MAVGVFSRLKEGLNRSTQKLSEGLGALGKRRLDDAALDELEDALISADLGTEVAQRVIDSFRRTRFRQGGDGRRDQAGAGRRDRDNS